MRVLELHASMRPIKRSEGRSSVQMSAYITRTSMEDERTGERHDKRDKDGVEFTGLVAQEDAPEWAYDRRKLWNSVEMSSKRKDAQVAREIEISMPHEFSAEQRREAAMKIAHTLIRRYGGAVEYAAHTPGKEGDTRNFHAHFLFTTRRFDQNGGWAKKDSPLDDIKRGPKEVESLREEIATIQNDIAAREKLQIYVEHLSFKKRGIDKEATQHQGRFATAMERRGQATEIGSKNRDIQERNQERGQLREEIKVVQIEEARERLKRKQQQRSPAPQTQEERYAAFYRETYQRRISLLETFQRDHGQEEKALQQQAAQLTGSLENAGLFVRMWRGVTGRTRQDRDNLDTIKTRLEEINRQKDEQRAAFERDRLIQLEALKAAQAREEQEQAQPLPQAVGETSRAATPAQQQTEARAETRAETQTQTPTYEQRRREYFRQVGAQRKAEQEEAHGPRPRNRTRETHQSPAPANDFQQAAPNTETAADAEQTAQAEALKRAQDANPLNKSPEENAIRSQQEQGYTTPSQPDPRQVTYEDHKAAYLREAEESRARELNQGPERER